MTNSGCVYFVLVVLAAFGALTTSSLVSSAPAYICEGGDQYNCSSFNSCEEVTAYFNTCAGDPSKLDGDMDGSPCESLCK